MRELFRKPVAFFGHPFVVYFLHSKDPFIVLIHQNNFKNQIYICVYLWLLNTLIFFPQGLGLHHSSQCNELI